VVDGHTGRLVAPKDPVALAEALAAYVRQPELIEQHGAAARERAERHYSISAMVAAYTGLYDRLCDTNNLREASQACAE